MPHDVQNLVNFQLTNQDLDNAFRRKEFRLVFQPQISTSTADIEGAESFVRWHHPIHGIIPPSLFLHFVETQGRSRELTNYLLRQSVPAGAKWSRAKLNWKMTVNVGLADLIDGSLPLTIDILLREFELHPSLLVIDVPERDLALNWPSKWSNVLTTLRGLRELGVGVALDCTGPQTLETEQIDPEAFDVLKIGGPALLKFTNGTQVLPFGFIKSRLDFAKQHGLKTIAVGVEDNATLLALKQHGFDTLQGFVISKPLSLENFTQFKREYIAPSLYGAGIAEQDQDRAGGELDLEAEPEDLAVLEAKCRDATSDTTALPVDDVILEPMPDDASHTQDTENTKGAHGSSQSHPIDWLRNKSRRLFSD
jgi:EAL domain-containing protein (putative c-di-GMP-specific phosphodiesterase class I)